MVACMYRSLAVEMRVDKPKEVPRGVHECVHCVYLSPGTAAWSGHIAQHGGEE